MSARGYYDDERLRCKMFLSCLPFSFLVKQVGLMGVSSHLTRIGVSPKDGVYMSGL